MGSKLAAAREDNRGERFVPGPNSNENGITVWRRGVAASVCAYGGGGSKQEVGGEGGWVRQEEFWGVEGGGNWRRRRNTGTWSVSEL